VVARDAAQWSNVMSTGPAVVVNKGGFLAALAKGVFGTIMVCVLCGTALGLYGIHVADRHVWELAQQILTELPEWQKAMPAVIADDLNDRRAPEYRDSVRIAARFVPDSPGSEDGSVVVDVKNVGEQIVSLLPLRVVVEDESADRVNVVRLMAAAPLLFGDDAGPLLPGTERKLARHVWRVVGEPRVTVEITDLRVWNGAAEVAPRPASDMAGSTVPALPPGGASD
jgi:hypothetical protein